MSNPAFPDRKCSNPDCETPDKLLKPHEQFGSVEAPVCWRCHSDPLREGHKTESMKNVDRLI